LYDNARTYKPKTSQHLRRNSDKNSHFLDLNVRNVQAKSFEVSGALTIYRTCRLVVGVSGRQASEQLLWDTTPFSCYVEERAAPFFTLLPLKIEARSSAVTELPKTLFLAFTMTQLYECCVQTTGCWLETAAVDWGCS
jgi:hypothetical protein